MVLSLSQPNVSPGRTPHRIPNSHRVFPHATQPIRTLVRAAIFFLKVFPVLPSRPVDWRSRRPLIEKVRYPTCTGLAEGELYRPGSCCPHSGIVVCPGVVPFGVDHPRIPRLGKALAQAGFVALLRKVFVHSVTTWLEPDEAERVRGACVDKGCQFDGSMLSADGRTVSALLSASITDDAAIMLLCLPAAMQERLIALSPLHYLEDLHVPLLALLHDRGDQEIPVGESRRLCSALTGHTGVHDTEMLFQHLDPVKGKLPWYCLIRELGKFFRAVYPLFRQVVMS